VISAVGRPLSGEIIVLRVDRAVRYLPGTERALTPAGAADGDTELDGTE
jgi:hypothetical protein